MNQKKCWHGNEATIKEDSWKVIDICRADAVHSLKFHSTTFN